MAAVCIHANKEMYEEACFTDKSSGFLVGLETPSKRDIFIVGLYSSQGPSDKVLINKETIWLPRVVDDNSIAKHYPAGCGVVGIWLKCENMLDHSCLESAIDSTYMDNKDIFVVGIVTTTHATSSCFVTYYHRNNGKLVIMSHSDIRRMTHSKITLSLRLKVVFDLQLPPVDSRERAIFTDSSMMQQADDFRDSVLNHSVLWIPEKQIVMAENITLSDTLGHYNKGPIAVEILRGPSEGVRPVTITLSPITSVQSVQLQLDVLGIFHTGIGLRTAGERMKEKLLDQLDTVMHCMRPVKNQWSVVGIHHFLVPTQTVPITVVYPESSLNDSISDQDVMATDQSLVKDREGLHQLFCLPRFQPYFRKKNLHWPFNEYKYLINPHCELTIPDISTKCQVAMVTGYYAYRHYMQDRFNDNGWGCAYRSLQTIWSWFQFQGYTEEDAPTHNEIQVTLVDCGDKETSFIGTKEWIGSFEVSTVLNHKLQIDSRIHQCPTGADMSGMGPVLLKHFQTQGTPVMIGGGVLAHTIIGVSYNRDSGDIKFLILDPHYTGSDELKLVLGKGCGWKSNSFWDQTASYNMCMPIRPKEI